MDIFDTPFVRADKVGIISFDDHVILLDYKSMTFKKFRDLDEMKNYADNIIRLIEIQKGR